MVEEKSTGGSYCMVGIWVGPGGKEVDRFASLLSEASEA